MSADPQKQQSATVSQDTLLAYARVGVNDDLHHGSKNSILQEEPTFNFRNYALGFYDIKAKEGISNFGEPIEFELGNTAFKPIYAVRMIATLPSLGDDAEAANRHPDDPAYVGARTQLDYKPFAGEILACGAEGETHQARFLNNTLREVSAKELHWKRRLNHDAGGSFQRAAYFNDVLGNGASALTPVRTGCTLWLPWARDSNYLDEQLADRWPQHAFSIPTTFRHRVPTLSQLIVGDVPLADVLTVSATQPDIFLRVYTVSVEKLERQALAAQLHSGPRPGITRTIQTSITSTRQTINTNDLQNVDIPLTKSRNPCVYVVVTCRARDDTKAVGESADAADTLVPPRAIGGVIQRPDPFRLLGIDHWQPSDGSNWLQPRFGHDQWQVDRHLGHTAIFKGAAQENLAVVTFSVRPGVENHGAGHSTWNNMNDPFIRVQVPSIAGTANAGQSRVLEAHIYELNRFSGIKNQMIKHSNN